MFRNKMIAAYFLLVTAPMLFAFQNCSHNYDVGSSSSLNSSGTNEPQGTPDNGQIICIPGTDTICPQPSPTPSTSPTPEASPSPQPSPTPSVTPSPQPSPTPSVTPSPQPSPTPSQSPTPNPSPSPTPIVGTCTVITNIGSERDVGFDDVCDDDFQRECGHNSGSHNNQQKVRHLVPKKCHNDNDDGDGSGNDICVTQHGCDLINEYMNDTDGILMNKPHHIPGTDNGNGNNGQNAGWHCLINGNCLHAYTKFHPGKCKGRIILTDSQIEDAITKLQGYWSNH